MYVYKTRPFCWMGKKYRQWMEIFRHHLTETMNQMVSPLARLSISFNWKSIEFNALASRLNQQSFCPKIHIFNCLCMQTVLTKSIIHWSRVLLFVSMYIGLWTVYVCVCVYVSAYGRPDQGMRFCTINWPSSFQRHYRSNKSKILKMKI
jgi:hypothetical protein